MGPSHEEKQKERDIREQEEKTSQDYLQFAKESRKQSRELYKPAINLYTAMSSGDAEAQTKALAPVIASLADQYKNTRESIERSIPPGPQRDAALARLERERGAAIGGAYSGSIASSVDKLANIGAGIGSFALNEAGAGIRSIEGASQTQNNLMNQEAQGKASTMGFLGDVASAGGTAAARLI